LSAASSGSPSDPRNPGLKRTRGSNVARFFLG
jgi:hypothetical protein